MALTKEQINDLKPGDRLLHEVYFIESDGVYIKCRFSPCDAFDKMTFHIAAACVSLPPEKPKYDPTRLFKKGDKVRVVEWNGRHFHDRDHGTELTTGCICEVDEDEKETFTEGYDNILVTYQEQVRFIQPCFLELVTPVEELEPYKLIDSPNTYNIVRDKETVMTIHKKSHPHAKLAAEAERDRLNEEWLALACHSEDGKEESHD